MLVNGSMCKISWKYMQVVFEHTLNKLWAEFECNILVRRNSCWLLVQNMCKCWHTSFIQVFNSLWICFSDEDWCYVGKLFKLCSILLKHVLNIIQIFDSGGQIKNSMKSSKHVWMLYKLRFEHVLRIPWNLLYMFSQVLTWI